MKISHFLFICLVLDLLLMVQSDEPCQDIELGGYRYNLHTLKDDTLSSSTLLNDSTYITLSLCKPKVCQNTDFNSYGCIRKTSTNQSYPATSIQTGPLLSSYQFIRENEPKFGISFTYIPFLIKNVTSYFVTTKINIECSKISKDLNCQYNYQNKNNHFLTCTYYLKQGCPELAVNSFWKFLKSSSIIFSIILWVCALFLLVFGYLAIRMTILLYGIFTGSFFGVFLIAGGYQNFYLESNGLFIFTVCLATFLGFLFGISLLTIPKLGYVNIGVLVAAIFSLLLQSSVLYLTGSLLAFYITFGVTGFIMAVLALMELKNFIIVCSSFTGAFLLIRPIGFFLNGYPNQFTSGQNFLISVNTPWQFYLYLTSIIILTVLGIIIQYFINKKVSKNKGGANGNYYLEEQGTVRQKLKKLFEFKEIKDLAKAGKLQFLQFKNIISDNSKKVDFNPAQFGQDEDDQGEYIQMQKMQKIQEKQKQKQKEKTIFITPKSKPSIKKISSKQSEQLDVEDLEQIRDSDSIKSPKNNKRKKNKFQLIY